MPARNVTLTSLSKEGRQTHSERERVRGERERERERQTDRQTDRQTEAETERHREIDRQTDRDRVSE